MKPQHEINKLIEKHQEFYVFAKKYIETCGLRVGDLYRVKDDLMITCENINKQKVYLKVENQELYSKIGSILEEWKPVYNQAF